MAKLKPTSWLALAGLLAASCGCAGPPAAVQAPAAPQQQAQAGPAPADKPPAITERILADDDVTVARLDNGLTVIVKPTRHAPVVCVRAYVRAGGLYEAKWLGAGISHLTEHLVAKGAAHDMGPGMTDKAVRQTTGRVKEIGGQSNAYTSLDHTCYYISATAGKAMDCVDLIADWMARPEITERDFQREHGVVQRELEMGKDDPSRQMQYAHAANFFADHPAAVPVIGYAAPLSKLTRQDVLAYHRRMYVPANMVLSVAGDVDVEAVLERICLAMRGFPAGVRPSLTLPEVPRVAGTRRVVRPSKALKETMQRMSFRTVPLVHEDLYALDVLSYLLTRGRASRLVQKIQRARKLVTSISSSSWTPAWAAGMFTISFRARPDKADAAERAILDELRSIAAGQVQPDELARAKRQKVADFVYSQQTVESIAAALATDYLSAGDVNFSKRYTQRIQAVTAEQVRAAARRYFTFDAMVITRLVPAAGPERPTTSSGTGAGRETPKTSMFSLPNGLRVVLHPTKTIGLVAMALVARGGVLLEDEQTNGLGTLMTALSIKGAAGRSAEDIARFFDQAGGSIAGHCGNNTFYWQATILDDSFDEAVGILADVVVRPDFPESELDILRPIIEARIAQEDENWRSQLGKFFRRKFYTGSPYRLLPTGSGEVVAKATAERIAEYHRKYVRAGSAVLAIYGNFDRARARQLAEDAFASMPAGETRVDIPPRRKVGPDGELHTLKTANQIAGVMVAAPGMKIADLEDRFPIDVLDTIISGWRLPSGWLHDELRGRQLVYVVHAYNWAGLAPGAFVVYAGCQPEKADQVVNIIRRNLDRASGYRPTQQEIDRAVNTILTAELLDNQALASLAMSAALDELYGFGYDFRSRLEARYRKVTPADVARVAAKYLGRGYVVAVAGPQADAAQAAGQDGESSERED